MGAFGDINLDDVVLNIPKGTYRMKLNKVSNKQSNDDSDRWFLILGFEVNDENADEELIGEAPEDVFITYWPELTEDVVRGFDSKTKKIYKMSVQAYKDVARALGAPEDDVAKGDIDFEAYIGTEIYADVFTDKNEKSRIQTSKMKNADMVDSGDIE